MPLDSHERELLEQAHAENGRITAKLRDMEKVAIETTDVASSTLAELHRQGQQLDLSVEGVAQVQTDVRHATKSVRRMRRFCCFALVADCCGTGGSEGDERYTRRGQKQLRSMQAQVAADISEHYAAKQRIVSEAVAPSLAAAKAAAASAPAAESRPAAADSIPARRPRRPSSANRQQQTQQTQQLEPPGSLGLGLASMDREELARQRQQQDASLHRIGAAMDALRVMATAIGEELEQQHPKLEELGAQAEAANSGLAAVNRDAGGLLDPRRRRRLVSASEFNAGGAVAAAQRQAALAGLRVAPAVARAAL